MKNGSRKRTHRLGLVGLGLIAISLAALLPIAVSFAQTVSFSPATDFAVGLRPWSVAIGDLNGDGIPDLAVANDSSNTVSILLGDGTGAFGSATDFAVGWGPLSVAIGDLNGDGKPDLAVANIGSNTVSILLNTSLPTTITVAIDIKPGSFPNSINPKSRGVIPVAILTTDSFDATTVDSTTVLDRKSVV